MHLYCFYRISFYRSCSSVYSTGINSEFTEYSQRSEAKSLLFYCSGLFVYDLCMLLEYGQKQKKNATENVEFDESELK